MVEAGEALRQRAPVRVQQAQAGLGVDAADARDGHAAGYRRGFDFALPYYFNLAPNYDATLTPRIMTDRGLMMGGEFRYLTDSSAGVFDAEYLAHDRGAAQERLDYGTPVPDQRWWYKFKDTTSISPN